MQQDREWKYHQSRFNFTRTLKKAQLTSEQMQKKQEWKKCRNECRRLLRKHAYTYMYSNDTNEASYMVERELKDKARRAARVGRKLQSRKDTNQSFMNEMKEGIVFPDVENRKLYDWSKQDEKILAQVNNSELLHQLFVDKLKEGVVFYDAGNKKVYCWSKHYKKILAQVNDPDILYQKEYQIEEEKFVKSPPYIIWEDLQW
jgi:hypothetical protein